MNTPSPFTTACELLDELVASTTNFPTIQHTLETKADNSNTDPGYRIAPDPIKVRQAETALLIALHEVRKRYPNMAAALEYANRAASLIQTAGGEL